MRLFGPREKPEEDVPITGKTNSVECPFCKAKPLEPCMREGEAIVGSFHVQRWKLANKK